MEHYKNQSLIEKYKKENSTRIKRKLANWSLVGSLAMTMLTAIYHDIVPYSAYPIAYKVQNLEKSKLEINIPQTKKELEDRIAEIDSLMKYPHYLKEKDELKNFQINSHNLMLGFLGLTALSFAYNITWAREYKCQKLKNY